MISNKKVFRIFIPLVLFVLCLLAEAQAGDLKKICILPFEVHASAESGALRESFYNHLSKEFQREKKMEVVAAGNFAKNNVVS